MTIFTAPPLYIPFYNYSESKATTLYHIKRNHWDLDIRMLKPISDILCKSPLFEEYNVLGESGVVKFILRDDFPYVTWKRDERSVIKIIHNCSLKWNLFFFRDTPVHNINFISYEGWSKNPWLYEWNTYTSSNVSQFLPNNNNFFLEKALFFALWQLVF